MAKILVVDDRPLNREFLVTLLGYKNHDLREAGDGAEGLQVARTFHPDLIVSDVLMPTMDGYGFVRQLRSDPETTEIPVVFTSAHYLSTESNALAKECGVSYIIPKPCDPQKVLEVIDAALHDQAVWEVLSPEKADEIDRSHVQLLTDQLALKSTTLRSLNGKLEALFDMSQQLLAGKQDPVLLLKDYCESAREIIGAQWAAIGIFADDTETLDHYFSFGLESEASERFKEIAMRPGLFKRFHEGEGIWCISDIQGDPAAAGLPEDFPTVNSLLCFPLRSAGTNLGWLCLADKLGVHNFTAEDKKLVVILAAQTVVGYKNALLHAASTKHEKELEIEITERIGAERELARNEEQLAGIIGSAMDAIVSIDQSQRIVLFNAAAEKMFRIPADEAIGQPVERFIPDRFRGAHREHVEQFGKAHVTRRTMGVLGALFAIRSDGEEFPIEASISQLVTDGKKIYTVILRDITERIRAEERLRGSEERFRSLVEQAADGIFITTPKGEYLEVNDSFCRMTGYPREELLRLSGVDLVVAGERSRVAPEIGEITSGKHYLREWTLLRKDGTSYQVEANATVLPDGRLLGSVRDVTERNHLEDQLRQSQKMEAVGRLAGGIAHDFNNLLTAINGYSSLTLRKLPDEDPLRTNIDQIHSAGLRAASLTRQLLIFSRREKIHPEILHLNEIITELDKMLPQMLGEDIEMAAELDPELGDIRADSGQIEQIIMNLSVNARDAMPDGGRLTFETRNLSLDRAAASAYPGIVPGEYVMLAVADTGSGIDPAIQAKIFEPFFTTKEVGKGTGLGLSTVFGIVQQSGGGISLESEIGKGSTFRIVFPRLIGSPETGAADVIRSPALTWEGMTVLIVEDDIQVREITSHFLKFFGFHVIEAEDGGAAIAIVGDPGIRIDLLLTDVVMPRMQGYEMAQKIRAIRPDLKIVFMSGHTDERVEQSNVINTNVDFIRKPFTLDTLEQKLAQILVDTSGKAS